MDDWSVSIRRTVTRALAIQNGLDAVRPSGRASSRSGVPRCTCLVRLRRMRARSSSRRCRGLRRLRWASSSSAWMSSRSAGAC
jgi:hypothetical protein